MAFASLRLWPVKRGDFLFLILIFKPGASATVSHSTRNLSTCFPTLPLGRWVSPAAQLGTPSLSSWIHLNISQLLILLFFEKRLPTSSCNRVITSHLAGQQSDFPAPVKVVLQSGDFPENQSACLASVSPALPQSLLPYCTREIFLPISLPSLKQHIIHMARPFSR